MNPNDLVEEQEKWAALFLALNEKMRSLAQSANDAAISMEHLAAALGALAEATKIRRCEECKQIMGYERGNKRMHPACANRRRQREFKARRKGSPS